MERKIIFKILSHVAPILVGVGTILTNWISDREQDAMIEEKVNEALAARDAGKNEES